MKWQIWGMVIFIWKIRIFRCGGCIYGYTVCWVFFFCNEDSSSICCWVTFHTKWSPVFSREIHSVLAVCDCSNQVFAFSFWNKPCGGCSRQVFPCAFKGSVWPSRASVVSKWERWFPLLSCCHLDKGASQSLIIYLMCDAIFPDFWVICATAGCTSRVGGKWEREQKEEEEEGKRRKRRRRSTRSCF